jgi:type IV secretory pathway VirB2 component (pilin)
VSAEVIDSDFAETGVSRPSDHALSRATESIDGPDATITA